MRIGKSIWVSKRIDEKNSVLHKFAPPIEIITRANYLTVMPASNGGFLEIIKSGEALYSTWNATANSKYFDGFFNEGDAVWLDGEKPIESIEAQYGNGASATAFVKNVAEINHSLSIRLERNQKQIKNENKAKP